MMSDAICQSSINFPSSTPHQFQQLIKAMTQVDPKKRPTMKSIYECSLFQNPIPIPMKIFRNQSTFSEVNTKNIAFNNNNNNNNNDDVNQGSSSKKLKKAPNCVTFSNYESFVNGKNCKLQHATSSLVYKSPTQSNNNRPPRNRKNSYTLSSNIMLKAYSSANSLRMPIQNRPTFLSDE